MANPKKNTNESTVTKNNPGPSKSKKNRIKIPVAFIIIAVVVVLVLGVTGFTYYQTYVGPFQKVIITVDNVSIRMDYFLKRAKLSGSGGFGTLDSLTNELIIKSEAPKYGITVTPKDIEDSLRSMASASYVSDDSSSNMTDAEYREWYRQTLNESGISDADYKEIMRTSLLAMKLQQYFADKVSNMAPQVHLQVIMVLTYDEANAIRARWEKGEDFASLAKELSLDGLSKENGGDIGWMPRGVMGGGIDEAVFDLETGNVTQPQPYNSDPSADPENQQIYYLLYRVVEKADSKQLSDDNFAALKSKALQDWLSSEMSKHTINYNFNSEINAWINWQLAKGQPANSQGSGG